MEILIDKIKKILIWNWQNKKGWFVFVLSFCFFVVVLFPFKDLNNYISDQILQQTRNQLFLQFNDIGIKFFPLPALKIEDVDISYQNLPVIKMKEVSARPAFFRLLLTDWIRIIREVNIKEIWGGDVLLYLTKSSKFVPRSDAVNVDLLLENINLKKLIQNFDLNLNLEGFLVFRTNVDYDLNLNFQPEGVVALNVNNFNLRSSSFYSFILPNIKLSKIDLDIKMNEGKILLEHLKLGKAGEDLFGEIKGELFFNLNERFLQNPNSSVGNFDFVCQLTVSETLHKDIGLFFSLLNIPKSNISSSTTSHKYHFKVSGSNFYSMPRITSMD